MSATGLASVIHLAAEPARTCDADPDSMFIDWESARFNPAAQKELRKDLDYLQRRVCGTCPFATECLVAALRRGETHGVCGGVDFKRLTSRQRDELRERYGLPCTTPGRTKHAA